MWGSQVSRSTNLHQVISLEGNEVWRTPLLLLTLWLWPSRAPSLSPWRCSFCRLAPSSASSCSWRQEAGPGQGSEAVPSIQSLPFQHSGTLTWAGVLIILQERCVLATPTLHGYPNPKRENFNLGEMLPLYHGNAEWPDSLKDSSVLCSGKTWPCPGSCQSWEKEGGVCSILHPAG